MRVQAGSGRGAAERDLAEAWHRVLDARDSLSNLRGVAAELLAERHGHGVHEMRATGLHDVVELDGLPLERCGERLERGNEIVRELAQRGEVHRRRKDVVRRLAHVDVIVGVNALSREGRHDLVRVHVRARAGSGLEDVDRELVVELARSDPIPCGRDAIGELAIEQLEVGVRTGGGGLDPSEPARHRGRDRLARDGEVGDRLLRLRTPESLCLGCLRHARRV